MKYNPPKTTILSNNEAEEGISADHPLFYTRERNRYLDRLTQQTCIQNQLPTMDLRRNMRIDHYLNQYNQIREQQQKEIKIKNSFLPPSQFESIFAKDQVRLREEKRQKNKVKKMQDQLYNQYVEEINIYQPPQTDYTANYTPQTVLQLGSKNKIRQLYLLDLQLGKLHQQEKLQKIVKDRHQSCQNNALLGKLSTSLMSSYMVYFDQIFKQLIDELLEDEVIYLNHMQANYRVNKLQQEQPLNTLQSRQTLQMMELVKGLEDLCDQ